jgi:predicted metal-binding membrane protein
MRFAQLQATVILLIFAASAWTFMLLPNRMMGHLTLPGFVVFWTIMMAAMMLPSLVPMAARYVHMAESQPWPAIAGVVAGYLGVWALTGGFAYLLAMEINGLTMRSSRAATILAVSIFATGGIYQFTALKDRCLARCRTPFAQLLEYASWKGCWRHLRVGVHHGVYCSGCCWTLMLLLFAFGLMNVGMMVLVGIVVAGEKLRTQGKRFSQAVGVCCLVLAVAAVWYPQLAPGLTECADMTMP